MIPISFPKLYLICMIKSSTAAFLESCKWAHDKFTWRDVKYVINGRSGGAGTSERREQKATVRPTAEKSLSNTKVGEVGEGKREKAKRRLEQLVLGGMLLSRRIFVYLESIGRLLTQDCVDRLSCSYTRPYPTTVSCWNINYNYLVTG